MPLLQDLVMDQDQKHKVLQVLSVCSDQQRSRAYQALLCLLQITVKQIQQVIMEEKKFKNGMEFHQQKLYNYYSQPLDLSKDDRVSGTYAWIALLSAVLAYDIYAIKHKRAETLTRAFWRNTEKTKTGIIPVALWGVATVHLIAEKRIRRMAFVNK